MTAERPHKKFQPDNLAVSFLCFLKGRSGYFIRGRLTNLALERSWRDGGGMQIENRSSQEDKSCKVERGWIGSMGI